MAYLKLQIVSHVSLMLCHPSRTKNAKAYHPNTRAYISGRVFYLMNVTARLKLPRLFHESRRANWEKT